MEIVKQKKKPQPNFDNRKLRAKYNLSNDDRILQILAKKIKKNSLLKMQSYIPNKALP